MSGGTFGYSQYRIKEIYETIEYYLEEQGTETEYGGEHPIFEQQVAKHLEDETVCETTESHKDFKNETFEEPIQQAKLSAKGLIKWEKGVKFVQPGVWLRKEKILACGGIDELEHDQRHHEGDHAHIHIADTAVKHHRANHGSQ